VVAGIEEASRLLARHYSPQRGDRNELPDKAVRL
jgi:uncharacterized membrane protein